MENPNKGYLLPRNTANPKAQSNPAMEKHVDKGEKSESESKKEWEMENLPGMGYNS